MISAIYREGRTVKDPRQLLYHYPDLSAQRYAQLVADFHHDEKLRMAERLAAGFGGMLVPSCCIHWRTRKGIPEERKVKVGYEVYCALKPEELTERTKEKYKVYLAELRKKGA
ncbi:hypothetical protein [Brevibacillus halotolerans]|uniref:hypothetical protein n=1 Tax=Brevibacillus halotolerans TaxID=1507437 RepID=UPI0015EE65CA|nr:hypothetical protein [Brevibacillus halotolerans]MBA4535501.1 hypothetical protein [Brevibacillus halotolerans]